MSLYRLYRPLCLLLCYRFRSVHAFRTRTVVRQRIDLITTTTTTRCPSPGNHDTLAWPCAYSTTPDLNDGDNQFPQDVCIDSEYTQSHPKSRILSISCQNLAGATSPNGEAIHLSFSTFKPFVACTGETGSGKSLLFARAVELLTGGKATASMVGGKQTSTRNDEECHTYVEMVLSLEGSHKVFAKSMLSAMGVDVSSSWDESQLYQLTLRRSLIRSSHKEQRKNRLKSICSINGASVTLKTLSALTSPLLVVVDASVAAAALARPEAKLAILDTGVDPTVKQFYAASQRSYRQRRKERQRIEEDLANRILPQSFSMDTEEDVKLMNHWIKEMEAFRSRLFEFVASLSTGDILGEVNGRNHLVALVAELQETDWMENSNEWGTPFMSALYDKLKSLRDTLRSLDGQIVAASNAAAILSSLSILESAATAIEKARDFLHDASKGVEEASEVSHDLLNQAENALSKCARFIEEDDRGLLVTLTNLRNCCPVTVDNIDKLILDWNGLARKHGISPHSLPSCHKSMINERDGNVEALTRLPQALASEKEALQHFESACKLLSSERRRVSETLVQSVNRRLPLLGMEASRFGIQINANARQSTESSAFSASLGLDSVEFFLRHGTEQLGNSGTIVTARGGVLHEMASSGEKARILLAIECSLPGSVRVTAGTSAGATTGGVLPPPLPVAIVYDEIDAHVGGHAAVALGHLLADQSLQNQIIAITHSPAVAAAADAHVVVHKTLASDTTWIIQVQTMGEVERRKELARMASGNVAVEEAEVFADALIRDGLRRRRNANGTDS